MKWLGQRDGFRCGPVALVNIMKWAGLKEFDGFRVNKNLATKYLTRRCCYANKAGSIPKRIESIVRRIPGVKLQDVYCQPSICVVKKHLKSGGIILLDSIHCTDLGEESRHYSLIIDVIADEYYNLVNYYTRESESFLLKKEMSEILKGDSLVYLLRRI